jgi:REP element-mobilizing transposase RayT
MKYDPKKYRRRNSYRKPDHDYGGNASYFITMCVNNKEKCLSEIELDNETNEPIVILTKYGAIIEQQIKWLCGQYEYIRIPNYVIMPDHIHFLIDIFTELKYEDTKKVKPIAELMGAFKSTSSKYIHFAGKSNFTWQRNYFDNIIRSEWMYTNIIKYMEKNPYYWLYGKK